MNWPFLVWFAGVTPENYSRNKEKCHWIKHFFEHFYIVDLETLLDAKNTMCNRLHIQKVIANNLCNVILVSQALGKQPGIHSPQLYCRETNSQIIID